MVQTQTIDRGRLERALRAAHEAGDTSAARALARELRGLSQSASPPEPARAAPLGPNTARFGRAPGADEIPTGGFTAPTLPDSYEIGGGPDYQRALRESRAQDEFAALGDNTYSRIQRYGQENLNPTPEQVQRYATIHGIALADAAAAIAGAPTDLMTGAINLVGDIAGGAPITGRDVWQLEGSYGGSQNLRDLSRRGAEAIGAEPVPREEMSRAERMGSTATQLGAEQFVLGGALARRGFGAARSAYEGARPQTSVGGQVLDEMAAPYVSSPASTVAAEAGSVFGATLALETIPEDSPFYTLGVIAGGMGGAMGSKLVYDGIPNSVRAIVNTLPDPDVSPRPVLAGERDLLSFFTGGQVDEAARRLQLVATNPREAARTLGEQLAALEKYGIRGGTSGMLSEDPALRSLERSAALQGDYSGEFSLRYQRLSEALGQAIVDTALPQNIKNEIGPDTFADSRRFTAWAEGQADNLTRAAEHVYASAEDNVVAARRLMDGIVTGAVQTANGEIENASRTLQYSIVDDAFLPLRSERNNYWNAARTSSEAAATPVSPAPFETAIGLVLGRRKQGLIPSNAVPSELISDIQALVGGGKASDDLAQEIERVFGPSADAAPVDGSSLTYQHVGILDQRIRADINAARRAENYELADQLRTIQSAIQEAEAELVRSGAPVAGLIQRAVDFETESYAPYFRAPTESRAGNLVGAQIAQNTRRGNYGISEATGERTGAGRFAEVMLSRANFGPGQAAREVNRLLSLSQSAQEGLEAAENFLLYSASRALNPDGSVNARMLRRWQRNFAPVLEAFPGANRRISALLDDVTSAEAGVEQTRAELRAARQNMESARAAVSEGWFSLVVGKSPRVAFDRLLNSGDPAQFATDIRRQINGISDAAQRDEIMRAWQDGIIGYIDSVTLRSFEGEDMSSRLSSFNDLFFTRDNVLEIVFEGNDEAMSALNMSRDMLQQIRRVRVAPTVDATSAVARPDVAQVITREAELPVRLFLGHLRGGGAMRSLRIALSKIPGINDNASVNQIIIQAMLNPEDMQALLRREGVDQVTASRIMTWARTINQASIATQFSEEASQASEEQQ